MVLELFSTLRILASMKLQNSTIGIWGFGRVGKAAASFFHHRGARIIIYDDNEVASFDNSYLIAPSIQALFNIADYVLPSPGIDIRSYYALYPKRWLCEVDLMQTYFKKPIIAITGSVGKTTITHLLTHLLQEHGIKAIAAGNIGLPMLEIIDQQDALDMVVLELSSFQLEYAQSFAPSFALWTNLYPNHLDRHGSMENYFMAKLPLVRHQHQHQLALVPLYLRERLTEFKTNFSFFSTTCDASATFCLDNKHNELHHHPSQTAISLDSFPATTFPQNWLVLWATFYLLGIAYQKTTSFAHTTLEHRLEKVAEINGITFYNDSKSTTPTSTLAALEQFKTKHILLFLGGLSKGIDRTPLIQALQSYKIEVFCFGKEAPIIKALCDTFTIPCADFANLEDAFAASTKLFNRDDCILFSPSGSSYDLFKNYEERGAMFKKLVDHYKNCSS